MPKTSLKKFRSDIWNLRLKIIDYYAGKRGLRSDMECDAFLSGLGVAETAAEKFGMTEKPMIWEKCLKCGDYKKCEKR